MTSTIAIHDEAINYFSVILSSNGHEQNENWKQLASPIITEEENRQLCKNLSLDEIKGALESIPVDSSPGLDVFGPSIFPEHWDIVKGDLMEAVLEFFSGVLLPKFYLSSFIMLIPKHENPTNFAQMRPIILCSVANKIFSKTLANRLALLLSKNISKVQGAFINRCGIHENVSLAQKLIQSINAKVGGKFNNKSGYG